MYQLLDYSPQNFVRTLPDAEPGFPGIHGPEIVRWTQLQQPVAVDWLRAAVDFWQFHPHITTDLLDTAARANFEEYPEQIYVDLHVLTAPNVEHLSFEQVGLVMHAQGVVSLHAGSVFDGVAERIETSRGLIRGKGPDYLFIRLIEAVLKPYEHYFDQLEGELDDLESEVVHRPSQRMVVKILRVKRQLSLMRRHVSPLRDVVGSLEASAHPLIKRENRPYVRDVRGKVQAIYERLDAQRSLIESLESIYLSSVNQRTNEVVRILTVFSAVFMPLTFIVGVYGMNFEWMPELSLPWAYPAVWVVMVLTAGAMIWWMRQKKFW